MISDIIIVGGGASGLIAAVVAARAGSKVTILEHKDKIGKKILATGNGKCNYTNLNQSSSCYRGEDSTFPWKSLHEFGVEETVDFFRELGIHPKNKNGYLYPNSEQASSVLEVLCLELKNLNVNIICNEHVESIRLAKAKKKEKNRYLIRTQNHNYSSYKVILATGGMASSNLGSDGSGYYLAKEFGHKIIEPVPALVQLRSKERYFKNLAGIRVTASMKLYIDGKESTGSSGELQLTNYGVSGIPVFEISRYASRALYEKKEVDFIVDFLPEIESNQLFQLIEERAYQNGYKNIEELFIGLLNKKLAYVIIKEANIDLNKLSSQIGKREINQLVHKIKCFKIPIDKANSFSNAQVSAGGVDTREVNCYTMESKLCRGLYLVGELLDVDGTCGGYNLQWAWSSGYLAGKDAANKLD